MNRATVIYHSADYDGVFCREIARKFLPDAKLIGWNFGDPLVTPPADGLVYVLDLSPDCLTKPESALEQRLIWIDHHKTSINKWSDSLRGYRIDGVAACRLAWQWFTAEQRLREQGSQDPLWIQKYPFPQKSDYVERRIVEPIAVRLAGEYDIWDKRDPDSEVFQFGLRSRELTDDDWQQMLSILRPNVADIERLIDADHAKDLLEPDGTARPPIVWQLLEHGRVIQCYAQKTDADLVTHRSYRMKWEGIDFLVLNTGRFNSLTFAALDKPETGHDALLGYMFNGKCWTVSLYHSAHRKDLDLSLIATKYGGGGHKGACGFTCEKLPFNQ